MGALEMACKWVDNLLYRMGVCKKSHHGKFKAKHIVEVFFFWKQFLYFCYGTSLYAAFYIYCETYIHLLVAPQRLYLIIAS